ncbi:MAG TPA: hypothetical protein VNT20_13355 [Flavisolibacter sp.]|jgi:hypothetical protein|nr:hypothetical protein [Flavisolibacter sp.]
MVDKQHASDNTRTKPVVIPPDQLVKNPNPKANENIRMRTEEPETQKKEPAFGVGSEITDGEDA